MAIAIWPGFVDTKISITVHVRAVRFFERVVACYNVTVRILGSSKRRSSTIEWLG